jgi:hypothetical protein
LRRLTRFHVRAAYLVRYFSDEKPEQFLAILAQQVSGNQAGDLIQE